MTTHIKIEAEDSGLGIAPIYARRYAEHGTACVDRAAFTDLLDAWSDGDTTRSWDGINASDDEEHIVAAYIGPHGIRIDSLRPVGETVDDRSLWTIDSLPFKTKVTPLTISQVAALEERGGEFMSETGVDGVLFSAADDPSVNVEVNTYWSPLTPDVKVVHIEATGLLRVVLNESDIFDGDTEGLKD
jgi:hypothetical protein